MLSVKEKRCHSRISAGDIIQISSDFYMVNEVGAKDRNKRKSWEEYAIPTVIEIGIVLLVLLIAAIIEWHSGHIEYP